MTKPNKNIVEQIAAERIERLFSLANEEFGKNPVHSHAWIQLAFRIATRNRVRIPKQFKQAYCKKCHSFLVEGKNKKTTKKNGIAEIHCGECDSRFKRKLTA